MHNSGVAVEAGSRNDIKLDLPALYTHAETSMPVTVVNGRLVGPRLFVSAVIHGEEPIVD